MAQTHTVKGSVISKEDGEPVIGASVLISGTTKGTTTDMDGNFTLSVPADAKTLTISYVGMTTQEVPIKDKMNVELASDYTVFDDVVVTAMGVKRSQKAIGYSATSLKSEDLTMAHTNDVMAGLAGKVAGVQVQNAGAPGSSSSVIIRGFSSLSGNNQPLYVVDGVPMNNSATYSDEGLNRSYDFGNGASLVNPEDIENMTILKGAAATALYGSRAANGVVMITTKNGKKARKGFGVSYTGGVQWETVLRVPQSQNTFGMGWYGDKTDDENGSWGPKFDGSILKYGAIYDNSQLIKTYSPIERNIEDFFTTGFQYSNNVSFNSSTEDGKSNFYLSIFQVSEDGIIPKAKDTNKQYNFSARASHKMKDLTLSFSANYVSQKLSAVTGGQQESSMYNAVMQTPRDISFQNLKDLSDVFNTPGYYFTPYGVNNPYWVIENYKATLDKGRFYGKLQADYDFLKYFKATARVGVDATTDQIDYGAPNIEKMFAESYNGINEASSVIGVTGEYTQRITRRRDLDADIMVTYDQTIATDWHANALVGVNGNERRISYLESTIKNLTIPTWYNMSNSSEIPELDQYQAKRRSVSVYGSAELAWKESIFLSGTYRTDWSSTLPYDNNAYSYAGVTVSWLWSNILPDQFKDIIDLGKVRLAWGKTGQDADWYKTKSVYARGTASSSGWGNSDFPFTRTGTNAYSVGNTLGSNTLSPEMTTEFETGLNVAVFHNRVNVDFAFYNRESDKQIFSLNLDPASGYNYINTNLGTVRNRGVELLVTGSPIRTRNWEWSLTWNFTKNHNKVLSLPEELGGEASIYGFSGGTGLYAIEGQEMGVYKAYTSKKDDEGHVIVDENGLPVITDQTVEIGSMNYDYQMGFGTTLRYKDFSISADFDFRKGGLMYSRTKNVTWFNGNAIQTAYNDRNPFIIPNSVMSDGNGGYVENTIALTPTNIYNYWNNGGAELDASDLIDKTYLKLRTVNFSWTMPAKWFKNTPIEQVVFSAYGNNLFLWTPKENTYVDPDLSSFGNDLEGQFGEYSANPSSRKYGFNLSVKF